MSYTEVEIICKDCNGTGHRRGGIPPEPTDICGDCEGTGYVARGILKLDLEDKLDSIIAEQASQREDLTAALTNIWNKVKDL